jgi:predicted ATP-grasp superfamily ATP-dependent carboligase
MRSRRTADQEYIPGGDRTSVDGTRKDGATVFAFHKLRLRTFKRTAGLATVSESAPAAERMLRSAALLRKLGWWGALGIETMHDPRDGLDKLMEVNPRFPAQLWNRTELGINEPLLCVQIARGERVDRSLAIRLACCSSAPWKMCSSSVCSCSI